MTGRRAALLCALLLGCVALGVATYYAEPAGGPGGTLAVPTAQAAELTPTTTTEAAAGAVVLALPEAEQPITTAATVPPTTTTLAAPPPTPPPTEPPTTAAPEPEPATPRGSEPEATDPEPQPTTTEAEPQATVAPQPEAPSVYQGGGMGGGWERLRQCESGGNYQINTGNGFYGAYQFEQSTWDGAVARAGYPEWVGVRASSAPPAVQDAAALQLYSERGAQPWPECGRYL